MSDEASRCSSKTKKTRLAGGRRRNSRSKLRKHQEIDHVIVDAPFALTEPSSSLLVSSSNEESSQQQKQQVGEGCYVTATVNNRRYHGVLIEQSALQAATVLHYQGEAASVDLNRRMKTLHDRQKRQQQQRQEEEEARKSRKRTLPESNAASKSMMVDEEEEEEKKRPAIVDKVASSSSALLTAAAATSTTTTNNPLEQQQQQQKSVQKFRYVEPPPVHGRSPSSSSSSLLPGYRILLATYADVEAAAENENDDDNDRRRTLIQAACQSGGAFVGDYYYQYERTFGSLEANGACADHNGGVRTSLGFDSFLHNTTFPHWYPLANLHGTQRQVLETLGMKKDQKGHVVWDEAKLVVVPEEQVSSEPLTPMDPRSRYRVIVVGAGIAGLSCCLELFRLSDQEGIDVEVVLLEGRSRLGGRLLTDSHTFKKSDGKPLSVDLGASWIHGIDMNPLAAIAREAAIDFVQTSEEVKMMMGGKQEIDKQRDEMAGQMFDKLLDLAVDDCWKSGEDTSLQTHAPASVRWYGSVFTNFLSKPADEYQPLKGGSMSTSPAATSPSAHRMSTDVSVDDAIGRVIAKRKVDEFAGLSEEERRVLLWYLKNVEFALGANISDLSMKYWDIDERHAFEGDHVVLRQGYSKVVEHMHQQLARRGDRFTLSLDFPVAKIEYACKTTTNPYFSSTGQHLRFEELSDACRVSSENSNEIVSGDFVVCAVPLGVLKESIRRGPPEVPRLTFDPELPFTKQDTIDAVGFGLLNKVYLQFHKAFWRTPAFADANQTLFGNASTCNPHHYMFYDMGRILDSSDNPPAVLMTLISGREAVKGECMSEKELISETMKTLRTLFSDVRVPEPLMVKTTHWGSDRFSRGSYTFLPPGTTDQDFHILQSPINGNGDSIILEGSETMRVFFAGEHTTALHPSMAHGALLSGYRAAKEIVDVMSCSFQKDPGLDRLIPLSLFRSMNPATPLNCCLCHQSGARVQEGSMLAFKRGSREVLVHNNCAEYSPEVEVAEGAWKNVMKACTRARHIYCAICGQSGASVGCSVAACDRSFHFTCAEDTAWRFDNDGKEFYCDMHRMEVPESRRISMDYYLSKAERNTPLACRLCGLHEDCQTGELLAFQQGSGMVLIHVNCARFSTIVDISEDAESRFEYDYRNIFGVTDHARSCSGCGHFGASIRCAEGSCSSCYHYKCAVKLGWDFEGDKAFRCSQHREDRYSLNKDLGRSTCPERGGFQHSLFSEGADHEIKGKSSIADKNGNASDSGASDAHAGTQDSNEETRDSDQRAYKLTCESDSHDLCASRLVLLTRSSLEDRWNLELLATRNSGGFRALTIANDTSDDPFEGLRKGDLVCSINGERIGSKALNSLDRVLNFLRQELELVVEVRSGLTNESS